MAGPPDVIRPLRRPGGPLVQLGLRVGTLLLGDPPCRRQLVRQPLLCPSFQPIGFHLDMEARIIHEKP